jgi:hypothetical protein
MPTRSFAVYQLAALSDETAHHPPTVSFSIEQALAVMRYHVACQARLCPRKAAALETLAEAGHVGSSTTKPR